MICQERYAQSAGNKRFLKALWGASAQNADLKWWCLLTAEKEDKGRNAITVVKILFLTTDVPIVERLITKGDERRFVMDNDFFDYDVENLNVNMDNVEKIGDGVEAGAMILGAIGALIGGIVALSKVFSKNDD